jgi:hypothetical protein
VRVTAKNKTKSKDNAFTEEIFIISIIKEGGYIRIYNKKGDHLKNKKSQIFWVVQAKMTGFGSSSSSKGYMI